MKIGNLPIISWDIYDPDNPEKNYSHTIKIPNRCMDEMLYVHRGDGPLFVEIVPTNKTPTNRKYRCLVFANAEVCDEEAVVVPYWSMAKLGLEPFDIVSIENVDNVRKASYIKVRANSSEYVYWDGLRETLEEEFNKMNAVSVGDQVCVHGIEFYVLELRDEQGIGMIDASIYQVEVKIDFDTPSDIVEAERRQKAELERLAEVKERQRQANELARLKREEEARLEDLKRNPYFRGVGHTLAGETIHSNSNDTKAPVAKPEPEQEPDQTVISREERAKMFEKLFQQKQQQ